MASRRLVAAAASSSSSSSLARLISRRGLGRYCPVKVNLWEDLMSPMRWKQSHFMVASVAVWAGFSYGLLKLFGEDEKNKTEVLSKQAKAK